MANFPEQISPSVGLLTPLLAGRNASNDEAVLAAALRVERALTEALADQGLATEQQREAVRQAAAPEHYSVQELALSARRGGNFIIPLVEQLKKHAEAYLEGSSQVVHPGATSQDILDSALILVARDTVQSIIATLGAVERRLIALARDHADSVCVARTLTQHSIPYSWGLRFAQWLTGVYEARLQLQRWVATAPLQWGGASGTNAALTARYGSDETTAIGERSAEILGLRYPALPWHSHRQPVIELAQALAAVTNALGTIANNVALQSRPELGELTESIGEGEGGSSAMPQKRNPIRSIMIRTAVSPVPGLVAELIRLGMTIDERSDGAWQSEWPVIQQLLTITEAVSAEANTLLTGLHVDIDRAKKRVLAEPTLLAERIMQELGSVIGSARAKELITRLEPDVDLARLLQEAVPELFTDAEQAAEFADPAHYLGQYRVLIERAITAVEHPGGSA